MTEEEWDAHQKKKGKERSARWAERNPGVTSAALRRRRAELPWYGALCGAIIGLKKQDYSVILIWSGLLEHILVFAAYSQLPFIVAARAPAAKCGLRPYSPSIDRVNPLKWIYTRKL